MSELQEEPELTADDIIYWMGWQMDTARRQYDVLLLIAQLLARDIDPTIVTDLYDKHEQGEFMYPPPWHQTDTDTPS
jgi:hypothetical protein